MPKRIKVDLTVSQVQELEAVRHNQSKPYMREGAAAVLKVAAGALLTEVAENGLLLRHEPETVHLWIKRYLQAGLGGWTIQSGRGRKGAFFPQKPS